MTRHLGVSAFLSVVIVVFFAVALYQPEGPAAPSSAPVAERAAPEPAREAETRPIPTADVPPAAVATEHLVAQALPVSRRTAPSEPAYAPRVSNAAEPLTSRPRSAPVFERMPSRSTRGVARKRRAFIHAVAGETVTDVALRVYGSPSAARALWMANRDILPNRDAPLRTATVLRTP